MFVVGVYTPDLLAEVAHPEHIDAYAELGREEARPQGADHVSRSRARRRASVGVDGVSLGGMVALEVGLRYPEVFGAVGTMQPAIRGREAELAERGRGRRGKPHHSTLRLLSSDDDPLLARDAQALRASCASGMWPTPWS